MALLIENTGETNPVGIDVSASNIMALSDVTLVKNSRMLAHSIERIKSLQRPLSSKQKCSKNREKACIWLKAWLEVRKQMDDLAHKLSYKLKGNQLIAFEGLQVKNKVKNHSLTRTIMDSCLGKGRTYKTNRRGVHVILVNPSGMS
ncbi:MAG: transposase [Conexivisphaerales archaeon]